MLDRPVAEFDDRPSDAKIDENDLRKPPFE